MSETISINSQDYWFKTVDMLQNNWALITEQTCGGVTIFFIGDTSGVFDRLAFDNAELALQGLRANGFARLADDPDAQSVLAPPQPPFQSRPHPNGPIYSSGRFWKS